HVWLSLENRKDAGTLPPYRYGEMTGMALVSFHAFGVASGRGRATPSFVDWRDSATACRERQ
ncbi:MAG: hypothetical protein WEC41_07975, partial [Dongiaceae bacterium]